MDISVVTSVAQRVAREYGLSPETAARVAVRAALRVDSACSGMGDDPLDTLKSASEIEAIKKAREAVSPWLWVFSLTGFGMALLNTRRIAKMYGDWSMRRRKA